MTRQNLDIGAFAGKTDFTLPVDLRAFYKSSQKPTKKQNEGAFTGTVQAQKTDLPFGVRTPKLRAFGPTRDVELPFALHAPHPYPVRTRRETGVNLITPTPGIFEGDRDSGGLVVVDTPTRQRFEAPERSPIGPLYRGPGGIESRHFCEYPAPQESTPRVLDVRPPGSCVGPFINRVPKDWEIPQDSIDRAGDTIDIDDAISVPGRRLLKRAWAMLRINWDIVKWLSCLLYFDDRLSECLFEKVHGTPERVRLIANESLTFSAKEAAWPNNKKGGKIFIPVGKENRKGSFRGHYLNDFASTNASNLERLCLVADLSATLLHETVHLCTPFGVKEDVIDGDDVPGHCRISYMLENGFRWALGVRYPQLSDTDDCRYYGRKGANPGGDDDVVPLFFNDYISFPSRPPWRGGSSTQSHLSTLEQFGIIEM